MSKEEAMDKLGFIELNVLPDLLFEMATSFLSGFPENHPIEVNAESIVGFTPDYKPIYTKQLFLLAGKNDSLNLPEGLVASVISNVSEKRSVAYYTAKLKGFYDFFTVTSSISRKNVAIEDAGNYYTASCCIYLQGNTSSESAIILPSFRIPKKEDDLATLKEVIELAGKQIYQQVADWMINHPSDVALAKNIHKL